MNIKDYWFAEDTPPHTRAAGILNRKEDGSFEYQIINEWQLCPKCSGTGTMMQMLPGYVVSTAAQCDLCNGRMIISKVNGLPPGDHQQTEG